MKHNPNLFTGDFEFLLQNVDLFHESNLSKIALKSIEKAPIFMMSIDKNNYLEKDKILIPDDYQLRGDWCHFINTMENNSRIPWSHKIQKAVFRGSPTSYSLDFFPNGPSGVFPSNDEVRKIVLENP